MELQQRTPPAPAAEAETDCTTAAPATHLATAAPMEQLFHIGLGQWLWMRVLQITRAPAHFQSGNHPIQQAVHQGVVVFPLPS